MNRKIGEFTGKTRGPLFIVTAGMHGNEQAGVQAMETIFALLSEEPKLNPDFQFYGRLVAFRGNLKALKKGVRYIDRDLNRAWQLDNVQRVMSTPKKELVNEDLELRELLTAIQEEVAEYRPDNVVMVDLHTTTADGGIFTIARDDAESIDIAVEMHAPVVTGMLKGIKGTTLHYFNNDSLGVPTTAVAFEGGQHEDPRSMNRSMAAVINCMRTIGCVRAEHVENRHDRLLQDYSRGLPKVARLLYRHPVQPEDHFQMEPGFENFQPVQKGQVLAHDHRGPIHARKSGRILMPLYQSQGEDGFFLIREVKPGLVDASRLRFLKNPIFFLLGWMLILPIKFYQHFISPLLGPTCRFEPSCSHYMVQAIKEWGPFMGLWLGTKRIFRCHPWGGHGYDPVPKRKQ